MFYTYVLESKTSGKFYIGQSQNLSDRVTRHNENREKSTRNRGPWQLLFSKCFSTRSDAVRLEKQLKKWKNKQRILAWIQKEKPV